MDTGTKAASIQSCDVAAALLFRIATEVFNTVRVSQVDPELKQPGYASWLEIRDAAAAVSRERRFPPSKFNVVELGFLLTRAHVFAAGAGCGFEDRRGRATIKHFQFCECDVARLSQVATDLIFTPGGAELLNHAVNEGGRGQSPEQLPGGGASLPPALTRLLDEEAATL